VTIYEHVTSLTVSGGTKQSTTLSIQGGLLRQVLVRASSDTTAFTAKIAKDGTDLLDWGIHTEEINDIDLAFPVAGNYQLTIQNATYDDLFTVRLGVQE